MKILHQGFDTLDLAIEATIPSDLEEALHYAKEAAEFNKAAFPCRQNGICLMVQPNGARGGYAFACDTGPLGASFLFKKPNKYDTWGVFVSVGSLPLATKGIGWARHYIFETLSALGIKADIGKTAINRIDYAVDLLAPDFELDAECFVMHSRTTRQAHAKIEDLKTIGHSGRTTSVTVGSNPNKQVIIYDKREEVMSKPSKAIWWKIWNTNLAKEGLAPLVKEKRSDSLVWRVELRAYKEHLRKQWNVRTFDDLDRCAALLIEDLLHEVRYTQPTSDTNRSRWHNAPIWDVVLAATEHDLHEMLSNVEDYQLTQTILKQKRICLVQQIIGLLISLAALDNIPSREFRSWLDKLVVEVFQNIRNHKDPLAKRIEKAALKYEQYNQ